jgi:Cu-Zn family superoxide dismutase
MRLCPFVIIVPLIFSAAGQATAAERATARMIGLDGADRGTVEFRAADRGVLVSAKLRGLPPGVHGIHLHAVGKCDPPFDSAGPHFNPRRTSHGFLSTGGGHSGDLPNLHVPDTGVVELEVLVTDAKLTEDSLLDADGAAVVVHAGPDDYATDPAGNSGARIACGVITP